MFKCSQVRSHALGHSADTSNRAAPDTTTFRAYIDNIQKKTGKTPEDFRKLAEQKGLLRPGAKATQVVNWLKKDHGLGHGHAMAIYATFKVRTE